MLLELRTLTALFDRQISKQTTMGVTIHYRGKLRNPADIQPLTDELIDICKSAGWKYRQLNFPDPEPGDEPFSGLTIQPHPQSESIWMLFNERGELSHPFGYDMEDGSLPWSFTKTQFAGADTHIAICRLFRYLEKQWFETFEVRDETNYWVTGDERHLRATLDYLDDAITTVDEELKLALDNTGAPLDERLAGILKRFWDRRKPPGVVE